MRVDSERSLPPDNRNAIIRRDNRALRGRGSPASEMDHIAGSSPDLVNRQLLSHECHRETTQESMVRAAPDRVATVRDPIRKSALGTPNRQPCDSVNSNNRLWASGVKSVADTLRAPCEIWLDGAASELLDPQSAAEGFPAELDAWSWHSIEPPATTR